MALIVLAAFFVATIWALRKLMKFMAPRDTDSNLHKPADIADKSDVNSSPWTALDDHQLARYLRDSSES